MSEHEQDGVVRTRKPRIAVVFGGRSSEHAISCVDRRQRAAAPSTPSGTTSCRSASPGRAAGSSSRPTRTGSRSPRRDKLPEVDASRATVALAQQDSRSELVVHEPGAVPRTLGEVDAVFPLLHGPFGEDGTLQGLLEMAGVRYVGAGVLASAVGMDKHYMKVVLQAHGLPVLPYTVVTARAWERDRARGHGDRRLAGLPGLRQAVPRRLQHRDQQGARPRRAGRRGRGGRPARPEGARRGRPPRAAARSSAACIQGFGDNPADASVVAEIVVDPEHEFYDFAAKYLPEENTALTVPADLPEPLTRRIQELSVQAFEVLSVEGLARVDFFVLPDERVVINEINTMPGFTPSSMFPRMWDATGLAYPELVDRLIQLALQRDTGLR